MAVNLHDAAQPRHVSHLRALREIASLINAGSDLAAIQERMVSAVCQHTSWAMGGIMRVNLESGYSELVARFDPGHPEPHQNSPSRWKLATSPTLRVAEASTPLIIPDAQASQEFPEYRADAIARRYHTVVVLPFGATDREGLPMILSVQSREIVPVSETDLAFLVTVTHLGAIAVEKAKRLEEQRGQTERLRRALAVNESLLGHALAGDSLTALVGVVETLLTQPLVVIDLITYTLLAHRSPAPELVGEPEWRRFVCTRAARMLVARARCAEGSDFSESTTIDFASCGLALQLDAFIEPLSIDGEVVGALVVFPRGSIGDPLDRLMAQEAKLALNVQLLRGHVRFRAQADSGADLLNALIQETPGGANDIGPRAERLGIDLAQPACLLAIGASEIAWKSGPEQVHRALAHVAGRLWPGAVVTRHESEFVILLPGADTRASRAAALARRIVREIGWREGGAPAVVLSEPCQRPEDYRRAWRDCCRALVLARSFGRSGVLSKDAFGPFADLLSAIDRTAARDFIARTLGAAAAYDARHKARLVETAAAFIESGCRYQPCADRLGIHVSTLRYRIARFEELTGADLDDPDTRFSFAFAIRLRQTHEVESEIRPGSQLS